MPRKASSKKAERESKPAMTPEARERQLVSLTVDLVEKQLRDGTAAPSVINHYLKISSTRESIEREMLEKQAKLIEAKVSSIAKTKESEETAKAAIEAIRSYNSGSDYNEKLQ